MFSLWGIFSPLSLNFFHIVSNYSTWFWPTTFLLKDRVTVFLLMDGKKTRSLMAGVCKFKDGKIGLINFANNDIGRLN